MGGYSDYEMRDPAEFTVIGKRLDESHQVGIGELRHRLGMLFPGARRFDD